MSVLIFVLLHNQIQTLKKNIKKLHKCLYFYKIRSIYYIERNNKY